MLRVVLDAVVPAARGLRHVSLVQGDNDQHRFADGSVETEAMFLERRVA